MKFNNINPSSLSPKIFVSHEIISAIPPRELQMVSGQYQSYYSGLKIKEREIHLHLNFAGSSKSDANELARKVAGLFCTGEPGEYEPTHMPGMALTAILESASDPEWRWGFGVVEYIFKAPRPYFHSTIIRGMNGTTWIPINPNGNVPIRPIIQHTMYLPADELLITIGNNIPIMKIRNPLGTKLQHGEVIDIDYRSRIVKVNGDPAMDYVDYTVSNWHPDITGFAEMIFSDAGDTHVGWYDEWM